MPVNRAKYINRELSWLDFNERVLQEANDTNNPLLERFNFLGIFSNNRDEFFRVRVATLNRMRNHKKIEDDVKKELTQTILKVQERIAFQEEQYTETYYSLIEEAKQNNIYLVNEEQLSEEQEEFVREYFKEEIRKYIFPLMLGDSLKYKNFKDKSVYLSVEMIDSTGSNKDRYALIEMPTGIISRFINLPTVGDKKFLIFLEDMVRFNLASVFGSLGYDIFKAYLIKLTRESELDIDNDVLKSFLEIMSESIKKRKKAPPVRFVYDKNISQKLLKVVFKTLGISRDDNLRAGGRYHNLKDFMNFPVEDPALSFQPLPPIKHPDLPDQKSKFKILKEKDVLFHFPYHSFAGITNFVWEAAIDPKVRAIKMTFYRVSRNSKMMFALINAARNGKQVTVFMELQARFDEEDNIFWAEKLQEEGVRIIPTLPGFKVHSKLILIRRKEKGENIYYSNISTGNYHDATARVYSDTSLLTSNVDICNDVNSVFHLFETKFNQPKFAELKVSPFSIRSFMNKKIEAEIEKCKRGLEAWIILKVNNLVDKKIVDKIYKAADAGVKVKLIIRGICVLKDGMQHNNIQAIGVVDRFLEHSRIFIFANGGRPEYYISSADLMSRNMDHRVEVVCPIKSAKHQNEIQDIIDIQLQDNVKARYLQPGIINEYKTKAAQTNYRSQEEIYKYLKRKKMSQ